MRLSGRITLLALIPYYSLESKTKGRLFSRTTGFGYGASKGWKERKSPLLEDVFDSDLIRYRHCAALGLLFRLELTMERLPDAGVKMVLFVS
jgi:hypothetical protein